MLFSLPRRSWENGEVRGAAVGWDHTEAPLRPEMLTVPKGAPPAAGQPELGGRPTANTERYRAPGRPRGPQGAQECYST